MDTGPFLTLQLILNKLTGEMNIIPSFGEVAIMKEMLVTAIYLVKQGEIAATEEAKSNGGGAEGDTAELPAAADTAETAADGDGEICDGNGAE